MTELKNARHERFAAGLADGLSQEKAYVIAGFSPNFARAAACNLLKHFSSIIKRRDELLAEREMVATIARVKAMKELQITKAGVMKELLDNAMIAKAAIPVIKNGENIGVYQCNISASNQAFMLLGKELGMFSDKAEVSINHRSGMNDEQLRIFVVNKYKKLGLDLEAKAVDAEIIDGVVHKV